MRRVCILLVLRNQKGGVSLRVLQDLEQMRFIKRIIDVIKKGVPKRSAFTSIQKFKLSFANKTTKEKHMYGHINQWPAKCKVY